MPYNVVNFQFASPINAILMSIKQIKLTFTERLWFVSRLRQQRVRECIQDYATTIADSTME